MPRETRLELKVGFFVLLSVVGLTFIIFSVSDTSIFEKGNTFKVIFRFANGVKKTAPVRVAGVDRGIVKDLKLFLDEQDKTIKAELTLWIKEGVLIPADSVVIVNQLGLMGEKYIEVSPGTDTRNYIPPGGYINAREPIAMEAISQRVLSVAGEIEATISGVNRLVNDEDNVRNVSQTLTHLNVLTSELMDIVVEIKKGEGTIGKFMSDPAIYDNLEGFTSDIKDNPWKLLYSPRNRIQRR